jgi:hypothetical protein
MIASEWYHFPILISLGIIVTILTASIVASLLFPKDEEKGVLEHDASQETSA